MKEDDIALPILLVEHEIMQNPALGAYALWAFIHGFVSQTPKNSGRGPHLWHLVTVLPLVFNRISRLAITSRKQPSGLRSILNRDQDGRWSRNEAVMNLQHRIQDMTPRTFRALNVALAFGLLRLAEGEFFPAATLVLPDNVREETLAIVKTSEKLGIWAGRLSDYEYFATLGVSPGA